MNDRHDFVIGLLTGSVIGAGLAIWCAPKLAAELRERVTDAATDLGREASRRYREVSNRASDVADRVAEVVDTVTTRGQAARDDVAEAVARGARSVEQFARASKT